MTQLTKEQILQREQAAFESALEGMLKDHRGEFVLFKDSAPVAYFPQHEVAFADGLKRFGLEAPFLVARVERPQLGSVSLAWDAGVMFGQ